MKRLQNIYSSSFVMELKGLVGMVHSHVFLLSLLWMYASKRYHTWREIDKCGKRWNEQGDFLILFYMLVFLSRLVRKSERGF